MLRDGDCQETIPDILRNHRAAGAAEVSLRRLASGTWIEGQRYSLGYLKLEVFADVSGGGYFHGDEYGGDAVLQHDARVCIRTSGDCRRCVVWVAERAKHGGLLFRRGDASLGKILFCCLTRKRLGDLERTKKDFVRGISASAVTECEWERIFRAVLGGPSEKPLPSMSTFRIPGYYNEENFSKKDAQRLCEGAKSGHSMKWIVVNNAEHRPDAGDRANLSFQRGPWWMNREGSPSARQAGFGSRREARAYRTY